MSIHETKLVLNAKKRDRPFAPMIANLPEPLPPGDWELRSSDASSPIPVQAVAQNRIAFVAPELAADQSLHLRFYPRSAAADHVMTVASADDSLTVSDCGSAALTYVFGNVPARPYFYPIVHPDGVSMTRSWPMNDKVAGENHDHRHHRSLWIAYGDVNGVDNWSEEDGHGFTRHLSLDSETSGAVFAGFNTTGRWTNARHEPVLTQRLAVTVFQSAEHTRLLEFEIRLEATHSNVRFGDTKEGGILSVRVASELDVPRTGRIENSYGGIDEAETWGKAAHWCDYSGTIEGHHVGIAVMDHPFSFRYPTHWHVRNYGLMTANPFGYAAFTDGAKHGDMVLKSGDSLRFRYRVLLHAGDASTGRVNGHYLNFVSPPDLSVE